MSSIIDKILNNVVEHDMITTNDRVLVGLSGGADSIFLLSALILIKNELGFGLGAAHVNHKIRGSAAEKDQNFCKEFCLRNGIEFYTADYDIPLIAKEMKTSEENAGRTKRYEYFDFLCSSKGYNKIAVAHNMNDSVETVLINLIRGCSLNGLGGIKPINGNVIRPIFNISREDIEAYLLENNISYCIDNTNFDNVYTRNKIRNIILKSMAQINPSVIKTIFSNLKSLREDNDYISECASKLNCISKCKNQVIINKKMFDEQHPSIKRRLIIDAFSQLLGNTRNIESKHVDILLGDLKSGCCYDMPSGVKVQISFDNIIFTKKKSAPTSFYFNIFPGCNIELDNGMIFCCELVDEFNIHEKDTLFIDFEKVTNTNLIVRSRKSGDKIIPYGMSGTKKLKQLFIELKVPTDKRDAVPIVCDGEEIVAVVPYRIGDNYKVTNSTRKILKIHMKKEN